MTGTLHGGQYTVLVTSRSVLLRMINVSDERFIENQNAFYRKNIVEPDIPQMTVWRMTITFCITKAINTHLEYAIFMAFPLQQWLNERASMLSSMYIACLVEPCSNAVF